MKKSLLSMAAVAMMATAAQAQTLSDLKLGIVIESEATSVAQEAAALNWIKAECPTVKVYTPATVSTLSTDDVDAVWVHVDRLGIEGGWQNLPAAYSGDATVAALKNFYEAGGSLLLTKHATQLATGIGLIDLEANCFGSGEGAEGFDNWTVNAVLGCDMEQPLDRRGHAIYEFMENTDEFGHDSFYLLGTGDPETSMWREDHNCFWIPADLGFGADNGDVNCILDFESAYNCTVLGTWGHVADYCGAGIIDFGPKTEGCGRAITIGLAAYELNPRNGGNAFIDNIDLMTGNALRYLADNSSTSVQGLQISNNDAAPVYYNLQGQRVSNPVAGQIYIQKKGDKVVKVVK